MRCLLRVSVFASCSCLNVQQISRAAYNVFQRSVCNAQAGRGIRRGFHIEKNDFQCHCFVFFFLDKELEEEQSTVTSHVTHSQTLIRSALRKASMAKVIHHIVGRRDVPVGASTVPELQQ